MIGVFGGTFDPIHFGHLRCALEIAEQLELSEVRMLPCGQPPHRTAPQASAGQRQRMLELALAGQSLLTLDTRELKRELAGVDLGDPMVARELMESVRRSLRDLTSGGTPGPGRQPDVEAHD